MKIKIYSREALEELSKAPFASNTSIISIRDTGDIPINLINKPNHILQLEFDDVSFNEHDKSDYPGFPKAFDYETAKSIVDFVYKYKDETDILICQCEYGESRSSAVAAAILEKFYGSGKVISSDERYCPNLYIYNILMKEFESRESQRNNRENI